MTENANFLDTLNGQLAQELGYAVWAFSLVERATYLYLKRLSPDALDKAMAGQAIGRRANAIKRLILNARGPESVKKSALQSIDSVIAMAKTRNHIAHNPWTIWIDISDDETQSRFVADVEHVADESNVIDRSAIRAFTFEANELREALLNALSELSCADLSL